jgi:hypothetical protein
MGRQLGVKMGMETGSPSALLLRWMAHIRMSFDDVCETSPRMWKALNPIVYCYTARNGDTARAPVAWNLGSASQSQDPLRRRSAVRPGVASGWQLTSPGRCRWVLVKAG